MDKEHKQGLVLTRCEGESVIIGGNVKVTVEYARNGRAKVRILAPREVAVHREEVARRIAADAS